MECRRRPKRTGEEGFSGPLSAPRVKGELIGSAAELLLLPFLEAPFPDGGGTTSDVWEPFVGRKRSDGDVTTSKCLKS